MDTSKLHSSQLLAILDVTRHLAEQRMVQPLLDYVASTVFDLIAAERCLIVLFAGDGPPQVQVARTRDGTPVASVDDQISRSILDQVRTTLSPSLVNDALEDSVLKLAQSVLSLGLRSVICVPLVSRGTAIGAIYVENRQASGQFSDDDLIPLVLFANQVVVALENARMVESLEATVAARTDELSQTIVNLRETQSQLVQSEKMVALGNLVAGVAHELRNPLNFVNNLAKLSINLVGELEDQMHQVALDMEPSASAAQQELLAFLKRNCQEIYSNGRRADAIIRMMLLHARSGSAQKEPIDLNALIRQAFNLAYHSFLARKPEAKALRLHEELQLDLPPVVAEPQRLSQALINLFDNACYALWERQRLTPDITPTIEVRSSARADLVEVRIRDNGSGVPPQLQGRLFEPFATSKPPGEGTGLGLSLTYDTIVAGHGGSISIESKPASFTEVTFRLPASGQSAGAQRA